MYDRGSLRRGSHKVSVGRGSPRRGSRKKTLKFTEHTKNPQHKIPLYKSIQHIHEPPEILRSIFSTDFCLQSNNGVSTSDSPPARNIVIIYPDYYNETHVPKYQNTTEFFFTQIWKKLLHLQKDSNPSLVSANTPMTIKPKTLFSIFNR